MTSRSPSYDRLQSGPGKSDPHIWLDLCRFHQLFDRLEDDPRVVVKLFIELRYLPQHFVLSYRGTLHLDELRIIAMFACTARGLLSTDDNIAIPSLVNA